MIIVLYIAKNLKDKGENISIILTDFGCVNNIGDFYANKFLDSKKINRKNVFYIFPLNNKSKINIEQMNNYDLKFNEIFVVYKNINVIFNSEIINIKKEKDLDINNLINLNNEVINKIINK